MIPSIWDANAGCSLTYPNLFGVVIVPGMYRTEKKYVLSTNHLYCSSVCTPFASRCQSNTLANQTLPMCLSEGWTLVLRCKHRVLTDPDLFGVVMLIWYHHVDMVPSQSNPGRVKPLIQGSILAVLMLIWCCNIVLGSRCLRWYGVVILCWVAGAYVDMVW